jgi:hypothetical protein
VSKVQISPQTLTPFTPAMRMDRESKRPKTVHEHGEFAMLMIDDDVMVF